MLDAARKTLDLFSRRERWEVAGIFGAAVVTGLMETFSVASIMPFMAVVGDPSIVERNAWLGRLSALFGTETRSAFLVALALVTLLALILAHAVSALTTWMLQRFVWAKHNQVTTRLLARYLSRPYTYFLGENSARISKSLLTDAAAVFRGVLAPLLDVGVKVVVALCVIGFLLYLDPVAAVAATGVLAGSYALLWRSIRDGQAAIGREQVTQNTARYKVAAESLAAVKELKVLGREDRMVRRFERASRRYSEITVSFELAARLPRNLMEVLAYGGILVLAVYLLLTREGLGESLPLISAFALAGYKLMPALQGIFAGLHHVKFNSAALDDLHEDLFGGDVEGAECVLPSPADPPVKRSVELEEVTFRYPGADAPAVDRVSLTIPVGSKVGLVGGTGSGKTTLVDLIIGLMTPTGGVIRVDGEPLEGERLLAWRRSVGYVPQEIVLTDESIAANIALGLDSSDVSRERVEWAASVAQVDDFIRGLPAAYDTAVGERGVRLSGGQRQRIGIARALYADPRVLVLDEATSALDNVTERALIDALARMEPARTVVMVAHRVGSLRDADELVVLEGGRVAARGRYEELTRESAPFRALAREEAREGKGEKEGLARHGRRDTVAPDRSGEAP